MKDNNWILLNLCVVLAIVIIGGNLGVAVNGAVTAPKLSSGQPGLTTFFSWCWTGLSFFGQMMAFQAPGIPDFLSGFIDVIVAVMLGWILIKWARGTSSG